MEHPNFRPKGKFAGDTMADYIDGQRNLKPCSKCGDSWRPDMLDECVACGLGAGTVGICPKCMKEHRCCR